MKKRICKKFLTVFRLYSFDTEYTTAIRRKIKMYFDFKGTIAQNF